MKIRVASSRDRDRLAEIDSIVQDDPSRRSLIARVTNSGACLLAERDGRVLGYAALEYTFFEYGFIPIVFVVPESRRQGVASTLLRRLEESCSTSRLFTSTNESNEPMRALLGRLGYVESGIIHNLDPGDPELVFCRFLDAPDA